MESNNMLQESQLERQGCAGPPLRVERRAAIRFQSNQEAWCAIDSEPRRAWGRVKDISVRGIGLLLDREVKPGTHLVVEIQSKIQPLPTRVPSHVVRCQKHSSTTWVVGCEFEIPLSEDDLLVNL
jgi:PilZ domain